MKNCSQCKKILPLSSYFKNKRAKDGLAYICKICSRKYTTAYYYRNREERLTSAKKRIDRLRKIGKLKTYKGDPFKRLARGLLRNALRTNKLTKLPCTECGASKVEAHHTDYSKPLDVIWLCTYHHHVLHRKKENINK